MRTYVYVDGFNLYYGALKGTAWKWLDLLALLDKVIKTHHDILKVRYFTAHVSATKNDPSKPQRQATYLRALQQYRPEVEVHLGHFQRREKVATLVNPVGSQRTAEVFLTEEKGSDVNLAVHMLNDCWQNGYDCAVIVSNDSDLAEALRLVKYQHNKLIGLVTPGYGSTSHRLKEHADFVRQIKSTTLKNSQLPDPIPGTKIYKPPNW